MFEIKKRLVIFLIIFAGFSSFTIAQTCPDLKKINLITRALITNNKVNFCNQKIKLHQLIWLNDKALPQIMNKEFLGVEPPPHWQLFTAELINDCYQDGNRCSKKTEEELARCVVSKIPLLMLTFGAWFSENCEIIDNQVIQHWDKRKIVVDEIIAEFLRQLKSV